MAILNCDNCKKDFETDWPNRKRKHRFCSRKCFIEFKSKIFKCKQCGKTEIRPRWKAERAKYCSPECGYKAMGKGADHPLWRGGRYLDKDGYVIINIEGKQVKAHRYIMEQVLGRKLRRDEVVHHINGNRQDNKVENLQVMTIGEHNKLHFTKDKKC